MKILSLTRLGNLVASNPNNADPRKPEARIISYLYRNGASSDETIKAKAGVTSEEFAVAMRNLRNPRHRIVQDVQ